MYEFGGVVKMELGPTPECNGSSSSGMKVGREGYEQKSPNSSGSILNAGGSAISGSDGEGDGGDISG